MQPSDTSAVVHQRICHCRNALSVKSRAELQSEEKGQDNKRNSFASCKLSPCVSVQIYPAIPGSLVVYTSTAGMSQLCRTKLNQLKRFVLDHNPASQFCLLPHKEKTGRWGENLCQDRMKGRNNSGNTRGGRNNGWKKATKTEERSLQTSPKRYWKVLPFH